MENKLTNEEIAKVFMMYWQSKFRYEGSLGVTRTVMGITRGWNITDDTEEDVSYRVDKCKLLLTPLSEVSDEDAIEVAKIIGWKDEDAGKYPIPTGENISVMGRHFIGMFKTDNVRRITYVMDVFQYLISKGYAVPFFISINHPMNGMNPIEMGIAVDKNLLP